MDKKYIPDNSQLKCDKGSQITKLKVTHHNNTELYGEYLASEMDMIPGENIMPFGKCSITGTMCKFSPQYWDKCNEGVSVNGYKLVFEDAHLLCKEGGEISVDFTYPSSPFWSVYGKSTGLSMAWQAANYSNVTDNIQRGIIYDVEKGKLSLVIDENPNDYRRKGNYAEMKENVFHREDGWRNVKRESPTLNINKPTAPGIDGSYEKGGIKRVTDSKYNSSSLQNTKNGRQLSQKWTEGHLKNNAIGNAKDTEKFLEANESGALERRVIKVGKDGSMTEVPINDKGYRAGAGEKVSIGTKPIGKVQGVINQAESSIRNSKAIKLVANSEFSKGIQNSKGAIKANDALWKATQYMESTPALKYTGKVLGRGAVVVGVAVDGYSIYTSYQEEGEFGDKTQQATGSAVGGMAGGWAGAKIGAIIGTAICPGIGTVIGGVIGGIGGALLGSFGGSKLVDWMF